MKTKLTLSISKDRVRRAKAYSAKRKKSVSQLVEEFFASLGPEMPETPAKKTYALDKFKGMFSGKLKNFNIQDDPTLAQIFRKRE